MDFNQIDNRNTISQFIHMWDAIHFGSTCIGTISIVVLLFWDKIRFLKKTQIPVQVAVVVIGIVLTYLLHVPTEHLVQLPVGISMGNISSFLTFPDFSQIFNPTIYTCAVIMAVIASLETLLNLEAVDKIDVQQRKSPTSRELIAQGIGNMTAGLIGGIPVTSVVVRGSVNADAGAKTKFSTIFHGILLLLSVVLLPNILNKIPLAALAAILIITGCKLANIKLLRQMWMEGKHQFLPFIVTVISIVLTDLLSGIMVGMAVSLWFILHSNHKNPIKRVLEKHVAGDVLRIELSSQVSFFSRPVLERTLNEVPAGGHVLIDARNTEYIDPDILDLIDDFKRKTATAHGVKLSFTGFKKRYPEITDNIEYVDYTTRELQSSVTPEVVLEILKEGNDRFRSGKRLTRILDRQLTATAAGQFPLAVVLSCIDSRSPIEMIFDLGLGDIFAVRIAGNVAMEKVLGSMEFSCAIAGAKLILVLGHTSCGAVKAAVDYHGSGKTVSEETGCKNLDSLIAEIQDSITPEIHEKIKKADEENKAILVDEVARLNVMRTMRKVKENSEIIQKLINEGKICIVGGLYDIRTGNVDFFSSED